MTQFHEGQEVEVRHVTEKNDVIWRKAKIIEDIGARAATDSLYRVQFPDGIRAVFDAEHIREVAIAHNDHFPSDHECTDGNCE